MARPWEMDWTNSPPANPYAVGPDPERVRRMQEDEEHRRREEARANAGVDISQRGEARQVDNDRASRLTRLADAYNGDQSVKAYRVAISQLGQALGTGEGAQADLALTYAFAKAMDPESVVRESEQAMVTASQPWFQSMVERTKKQFGMDGAGNYTPEARQALRIQISNAVAQRVKVYDARRNYFEKQAQALGVDPTIVIGEHDAKPFVPMLQEWVERSKSPEQQRERQPEGLTSGEQEAPDGQVLLGYQRDESGSMYPVYGFPGTDNSGFEQSPVGQTAYGVNEGIAGTLGLPIDIPNALNTGMVKGANALLGTDLKTANEVSREFNGEDSLGSGGWWQNRFRDWGFTGPPPDTQTGKFLRRAGQSVGAAMMPIGGAGVGAGKAAMGLTAAAGGGAGAATAQQMFPGNPAAEFAGEMIGSAGTGLGMARVGQGQAQRAVEAAVPTVDQLKAQARQLYQAAEARGVIIRPAQTKRLARDMRRTLAQQGRVSPTGRISEVYPKAREAIQLVQDYAGKPMTPTQLQVVREVVADGLTSQDKSEQRIAGLLLDTFDTWAEPFAPELPAAREVASRYLQTQQLEQASELAGARAGQFTGSGYENALRTEYRALDRGAIRGSKNFNNDVLDAVERVSRGTTGSNAARAAGRFAPTGPVSLAAGAGVPAGLGAMLGGLPGAAVGGSLGLVGLGGRAAATRMGINNARQAEMIARNGGNLAKAPLMDPETERLMLLASMGLLGQHVDPTSGENQQIASYPNPFAGTEDQPRRRLFRGLR